MRLVFVGLVFKLFYAGHRNYSRLYSFLSKQFLRAYTQLDFRARGNKQNVGFVVKVGNGVTARHRGKSRTRILRNVLS